MSSIPVDELHAYADLVLRAGVNLEQSQKLLLLGNVEHRELIDALAERAYACGAGAAYVLYLDEQVENAQAAFAPSEALATALPPWHEQVFATVAAEDWATIMTYSGRRAAAFPGTQPERLSALLNAFGGLRRRTFWGGVSACICPGLSSEWAEGVYGSPDVSRLWADLRFLMRLDAPDPVAAWERHMDELDAHAAQLDAAAFAAVRFRGGGTDLRVPLHPWAKWGTARFRSAQGRRFIYNLPTEEVAVTPDFRGVEGTAVLRRPALIDGVLVEGLVLGFEGGRVVDVQAASNADVVRAQLATDAGACRLGELALVEGSSRPGQLSRTFDNILIDENATCHIAWGCSYPEPNEVGTERDPAECAARGVNVSTVHQDVMLGGPDVEVLGVTAGGDEVPILLGERWQLDPHEAEE